MTHRILSRTAILPVAGALLGVEALIWSMRDSEIEIPDRPSAVAISVGSIPTAEKPLPAIPVPALRPQAAPEPGSSEPEIHVPPRPTLTLAELSVDAVREPLPVIVVPDLVPPCPGGSRSEPLIGRPALSSRYRTAAT